MQICAVIHGLSGERAALAAYVLRTLLGTLGVPFEVAEAPPPGTDDRLVLWYGTGPCPADVAVEIACLEPPTATGAIRWLTSADGARQVAFLGESRAVEGRPLYRDAEERQTLVGIEGTRARLGIDLVGAAGFWLMGREESAAGRDILARYCGASSPRARHGLLAVPVVTDLMHVLWDAIQAAATATGHPVERAAAWPDDRAFAVLLSHDIDLWRKRTARQLAKELVRSLPRPQRLPAVLRAFRRGPDPWGDLEGIADLEAARDMRSTFFMLAGRDDWRLPGLRVVHRYPAETGEVQATARRLAERGCEVALHSSLGAYFSPDALADERQDVEALAGGPVAGVRQHFLRFDWPRSWRCQARAGLRYDATLGYHDEVGYRAGLSFPFRPFDGEELPVLELPLVVMDGVLRERKGLGAEAAWDVVRGVLERTEADGALCSLLWHNHYFCDLDAPGYRGVYERALDWIREHNGWGATAREICQWWDARSASVARRAAS